MPDKESKLTLADIPDLSKLEEHGVSIGVPTPADFVIADPWAPAGNGATAGPSGDTSDGESLDGSLASGSADGSAPSGD